VEGDDSLPGGLRSFYAHYDERGRLQRSDGRVEFARTREIALRTLPRRPRSSPTSAVVPAPTRCGSPDSATR
jgi:hypothetical protein